MVQKKYCRATTMGGENTMQNQTNEQSNEHKFTRFFILDKAFFACSLIANFIPEYVYITTQKHIVYAHIHMIDKYRINLKLRI